ncbi:hypothetical protein ACO0LG_01660 [Undibacterium sp. Ji42W]|uniref:hypothetical protein n=1 Tax=Undibacterium sp. Ji42W TaxID=3413039 RepID=UPI003BF08405
MSSTNLADFRDQYIARASTLLKSADLAQANINTLVINGALFGALDKVINAPLIGRDTLALFDAMTSADIDVWLTDASHRSVWQRLCSDEAKTIQVALQDDVLRPKLLGSALAWEDIMASSVMQTWIQTKAAYLVPYIAAIPGCLTLTVASRTTMDKFASVQAAMTLIYASTNWLNAVAANTPAQDAIGASLTALRELAKSSVAMTALYTKLTTIMAYLFADATASLDAWNFVSSEITAGRTAMPTAFFADAGIRNALHGNTGISTAMTTTATALYQWLFTNKMTVVQRNYNATTAQQGAGIGGKFLTLAIAGTYNSTAGNFYLISTTTQYTATPNGSTSLTLTTANKQVGSQNGAMYFTDVSTGTFYMSIGYLAI